MHMSCICNTIPGIYPVHIKIYIYTFRNCTHWISAVLHQLSYFSTALPSTVQGVIRLNKLNCSDQTNRLSVDTVDVCIDHVLRFYVKWKISRSRRLQTKQSPLKCSLSLCPSYKWGFLWCSPSNWCLVIQTSAIYTAIYIWMSKFIITCINLDRADGHSAYHVKWILFYNSLTNKWSNVVAVNIYYMYCIT